MGGALSSLDVQNSSDVSASSLHLHLRCYQFGLTPFHRPCLITNVDKDRLPNSSPATHHLKINVSTPPSLQTKARSSLLSSLIFLGKTK